MVDRIERLAWPTVEDGAERAAADDRAVDTNLRDIQSTSSVETKSDLALNPDLRDDVDALWPQLEAGMRYLQDH